MKIAAYSVASAEKPYFEQWMKENNVEVKLIDQPLSIDNLDEAAGCIGVCLQQAAKLGDESFYQRFAEMGLKYIGVRTAGIDLVDLASCRKYNIKVTNVPAYSPRAIAEMGLTQALALLRKLGEYQQTMAEGKFSLNPSLISNEIYNLTVGLVGLGHIGGETARLYRALGANVIAYNRSHKMEYESVVEYTDLQTVIEKSDIISLHTPLTPQTKNMIGAKQLTAMKKNAILINMSRGGLVDTAALINALQNHEIAGAGLDTLADEAKFFRRDLPIDQVPADYRTLAAMPNVIVTPHVAFYTTTAVENMVKIGLDNIYHQEEN